MRFAHFLCGFGLNAQFRRWPQQQARQANRLSAFTAITIVAVIQTRQRRADFRQQTAFAIQLAKQQPQVFFTRGLVRFVT
ncbi:hypothetical protein D3C78_1833600 [compost metagenome]